MILTWKTLEEELYHIDLSHYHPILIVLNKIKIQYYRESFSIDFEKPKQ